MPSRTRGIIVAASMVLATGDGLSQPVLQANLPKKPKECVVQFAGTPCRTVRSHETHSDGSFGLQQITRIDSVYAVNQDGSESLDLKINLRRYWLLAERTQSRIELVLRNPSRVVHIDHRQKLFTASERGAHGYQVWKKDDAQCSGARSQYWYLSTRLPDSIVAGVRVVSYEGSDGDNLNYVASFAPALGCQQMRFLMIRRGFAGWITSTYESVVDSYEIGQPSPWLFTIPARYKQVTEEEFESGVELAP